MSARPLATSCLQPFTVVWSPTKSAEVMDAVRRFELPPQSLQPGWALGCDSKFIEGFRRHWLSAGAMDQAAATLNRYPQFLVDVGDGDSLHVVYVRGESEGRRPLLLLHGWPGSHFEFWDIIDRLAFPSRFGVSAENAFDLIIPSLPGYGFSSKPTSPIGARSAARWLAILMRDRMRIGRYLVHGNDWGAAIAPWLALDPQSGAVAIHLNQLAVEPHAQPETEEERAWASGGADGDPSKAAYYALHTTKPQSLAYLAFGNPVGQAAWILERFHDWSNISDGGLETAFGLQALLTNVLIYVMTDSFATAAWFYAGSAREHAKQLPEGLRVVCPTGFSIWRDPRRPAVPPRRWVERGYELCFWAEYEHGGHFPAMQAPADLVSDLVQWACAASARIAINQNE
jgi:pimeloyl-ACP methyl ester carboxylesterase